MIFVDARELEGKVYGVGTYLRNLLREWEESSKCFTLIFSREPSVSPNYPYVIVEGDGKWKWENFTLRKFLNSRKECPYFTPGYTIPISIKNSSAFVLHDISFIDHPRWLNPTERLKLNILTRLSSKRANFIFTVSNFSRKRIMERLKVPEERIIIAQQGLAPAIKYSKEGALRFREKYGINEKIILYVGAIFRRRNIPLLLEGFSYLGGRQEAELVIVGEDRGWPRLGIEEIARGMAGVHYFSYLSEEELIGAYSAADLFVYLSEYEGFGMTPMEAASCNTPLLFYPAEALKEIYGDAACYIESKSGKEVGEKMGKLLRDSELREKMILRLKERIKLYSWKNAAEKIKGVMFELDPFCDNS